MALSKRDLEGVFDPLRVSNAERELDNKLQVEFDRGETRHLWFPPSDLKPSDVQEIKRRYQKAGWHMKPYTIDDHDQGRTVQGYELIEDPFANADLSSSNLGH